MGWLVTAGLSKKRVDSTDASKLDPMVSALFFCTLRAPGRHSRPGLPQYCVIALAEDRRFAAAKRAGGAPLRRRDGDNARCDALHLITAFGGASPQGEAFWDA